MAKDYFTVPGGVQAALAFSLAGAMRGQFLLDADMTPPQPAGVTEVSTRYGIWRRVDLRCETRGHYSSENRSTTVAAWVRV